MIIIMCGGVYDNFKQHKALTKINGERLVDRTIRLLKQNGINDIYVSATDPNFIDYKVLKHENTYKYEDGNVSGYWVDAYYPTDKPCIYLHGDVYYSEDAIKKILNYNPKVNTMIGNQWALNENHDKVGEPFGWIVVDQKKYWGFLVPDIDKVQANVPLAQKYMQRAKKLIANTKDAYLLGIAQAGVASGNQLGTVALTSSNIYATCVELFEKLARANAIDDAGLGEDGKRPFLILPPEVISIVKQSDEAKHATTLGDQTVRKGAIMQFAGFDIKQSTVFPAPTTTTAQTIIAGTTEAITYADQILKTESIKDKDYFGDYVRGLYVYGGLVVQPECLASASVTI